MNIFPKGEGLVKPLFYDREPAVTAVGYNDFEYLKPQSREWVQGHHTLHFVLSGSGTLKMANKVHKIGAKQIFIIPPNEPMMYYPNPDDRWKYIWFTLAAGRVEKMLAETGASVNSPVIIPDNGDHIASVLMGIFRGGGFADDYRVVSVFYELMHCISRNEDSEDDKIRSMIDANFADVEFSIAKLCSACGLSHAQLCRVFAERFGMTAKRYLIERRMEYAKELLRNTELKLATVALSSGYSDPAHFMKEFKRYTGVTAGCYREEWRSSAL